MPTSNSKLAFEDCYEILNIALDDVNGARVRVPTHADAMMLRTRLHTARRIDRQENARTYQPDEPMHGKSEYDRLVVRIKEIDGGHFVYVERVIIPKNIQPLSEVEDTPKELEPPKSMKLISPPQQEVTVQRILRRA